MTPEMTKSLIQSVQDQCHHLREEITRNTAEKIQDMQQQLKDEQYVKICNIDDTQQTKINEILSQSDENREAVQNLTDRLNTIHILLNSKELQSDIIINIARDIEEITEHLKTTDSMNMALVGLLALGQTLYHVK